MDNVSCPICFSNKLLFQFKIEVNNFSSNELNYYSCNNCFYFFRIPDTLFIDYKNDYINKYLIKKSKQLAKNYFKYSKQILNLKNNLLEIGGSLGYYCKIVKNEINLNCINFELSNYAINYSNNLGIDSINNLEILEHNSFDNIVSFHVLEHIPSKEIIRFFENMLSLLNENGKILIITPNANSSKLHFFKNNYGWLAPNEHIGFFDKRTITFIINNIQKSTYLQLHYQIDTKIPSYYHYPVVSLISKFRNNFKIKSTDFVINEDTKLKKQNFKIKFIQFIKSTFSFFIIIEKLFLLPFYLMFDSLNNNRDELVILIQKKIIK